MRYVLSEKTLSLSKNEFYSWLNSSRASEPSKQRYMREWVRYHHAKPSQVYGGVSEGGKKSKSTSFSPMVGKKAWRQKEGFYGRSVRLVSMPVHIYLHRRNFRTTVGSIKNAFDFLKRFGRGKFIMLKVRYFVYSSNNGLTEEKFMSSKVMYANEYKYALLDLIRKINNSLFCYSGQGIIITTISIKFYSGERK